jgi:hypothetical protein
MQLKTLFFSILFFITFYSCSFIPNEIKTAQRIMDSNPDSALYLLQHIQPIRTLTDADRAIYGILYFQALDKNSILVS